MKETTQAAASMSTLGHVLKEIVSLLYWALLAACTIGPGTVVTCARAGFEQGLQVVWALIFASIMAFIIQEGSARLTIHSGKSLGECLRIKYRHIYPVYNVSIVCWIVSASIMAGNGMFECNNWAGGMSAIYIMPGVSNTTTVRVSSSLAFAVLVIGLLYWDKVHEISVGCGVIMVSMVILFLIVVWEIGIDWARFGEGLVPSFPEDSSSIVISLVGTTAIGYNIFLGSSMAQKNKGNLASARRGIAFAVLGALSISMMIMIIGDGVIKDNPDDKFSTEFLAALILDTVGEAGLWFFSIGFTAAALSSMLTAPLAANITAESIFSFDYDPVYDKEAIEKAKGKVQYETDEENGTSVMKMGQYLPVWVKHTVTLIMASIASILVASNVPVVTIIQVAQVFNGCLLPLFTVCLFLCLNDSQFMGRHHQKWWANSCMVIAVTITFLLAYNAILSNIFSFVVQGHDRLKLIISFSLAVVTMVVVIFTTSLKADIAYSFKQCCKK